MALLFPLIAFIVLFFLGRHLGRHFSLVFGIIMSSFSLIIVAQLNIVYCGTVDVNPIHDLQTTATDIVLNQMTDAELETYMRSIGYRPPIGWEAVDHYHGYGQNNGSTFNYQGFLLWLAGTSILFIFSRWGDIIRDFLFSLPSRAISAVPDIYTGLATFMTNLGRGTILRNDVLIYTNNLLQDPQNAILVQNAIETYLRSRGVAA